MSRPDPLAAFFLSLDESPGDQVTLLALADWYEEQDQSDNAGCLRWLAATGLYPFHYWRDGGLAKNSRDWHDGWYWWALDHPSAGADWGHPLYCRLPEQVWRKLRRTFEFEELVFKEYPTRRAAYEALFEAWPRVGRLPSPATQEART
jgi:hypothetical protein